jgi:hypothetical protein
MSGRRNCINNSSFSYTGKEQSPLRFGLSAEGYPVNSILEGYDKNIWVVEIKNNRKIWVRKDDEFRITYELPLINKLEDYEKQVENEIVESSSLNYIVVANDIKNTSKIEKESKKKDKDSKDTVIKKPTNYNIFLTYRLKKLKELYKNEKKENKEIFNIVIKEWNEIKNKPEELKLILEEALSCI